LILDAWKFYPTPPGWDINWHAYNIAYAYNHWPDISWNYQLAGGMLVFRQFPPFPIVTSAFIMKLTGLSVGFLMEALLLFALSLAGIIIYALAWELTKDRQVSLVTSFLVMSSTGIWFWAISCGNYARILAIPLLPLSALLTVRLLDGPESGAKRHSRALLVIIVLSLSLSIHPLVALFAFISTGSLITFRARGLGNKTRLTLFTIIPALLINLYYIAPRLATPTPPVVAYQGPAFDLLLRLPHSGTDLALPSLTLPYTLALILATRKTSRGRGLAERPRSQLLAFGSICLLLVVFLTVGYADPRIYGLTFYPETSIVFLPFFLMPFNAILLRHWHEKLPRYRTLVTVVLIVLILGSTIMSIGTYGLRRLAEGRYEFQYADEIGEIARQLRIPKDETLFRVAVQPGTTYGVYMWLHNKFSAPDTTDGGFYQGHLNLPRYNQFNEAVFRSGNLETKLLEAKFQLDWWGIRWVILTDDMAAGKFYALPQLFAPMGKVSGTSIHQFEYLSAQPVAQAVKSPTVLIVGSLEQSYDRVLSDLSLINLDSRYMIPAQRHEYVDEYSIEDLCQFSIVFMYGYKFHDREKGWALLRQYVSEGGSLVVDTGFSPDAESPSIPLPSPVESTFWRCSGGSWAFTCSTAPILDGFDLSIFSPPKLGDEPWSYSTSRNESVRPWSQTILWNEGNPVMAAGRYGKGHVLWSGLNLPFHADYYRNAAEASLLTRIFQLSMGSPSSVHDGLVTAKRHSPEKITIDLPNGTTGALVREFYYPAWRAFLEEKGKRVAELVIYRAGPEFMFAAARKGGSGSATVVFEFDKSIEFLSLGASLLALATVICVLSRPQRAASAFKRPFRCVRRKVSQRWREE